jgi:hypothetical protein
MLRRATTVTAVTVAVVSSVAIGWAAAPRHASSGPDNDLTKARHILTTLTDPGVRKADGFPAGKLIKATVCVHGQCAHRTYHAAPACTGAVCIGTSLVARKLPHHVTISIELA